MVPKPQKMPRVAVRAVIIENGKLLLVNAWAAGTGSDLLCAPGGGVEPHTSLPENLKREVMEETGLDIEVGPVCLVNEFHDPGRDFHQVDIYFRADVIAGEISDTWQDPEKIVYQRVWASAAEMANLNIKPDSLAAVAFGQDNAITYDPLEPLVR